MLFQSFIVIYFLNVFLFIDGKENFESVPKQLECTSFDKDLVDNLTCSYKQISWKKAKYNFDGYFKSGIEINNAIFKGTAYRRGTNMEYRVFGPSEYTVDLCAFLNGTWSHIIVDLVSAYIKKRSKGNNIFHSCPFSGYLFLHDVIMDEHSYSGINFLPDGDFMYKSQILTQYNKTKHVLVEVKSYVLIKNSESFRR